MILDRTLHLETVLAGAIDTEQLDVHVVYQDWNSEGELIAPAITRATTNGTTVVTILDAPVANPKTEVQSLSIYNADTSTHHIVAVKTVSATVSSTIVNLTVSTLQTLHYERGVGWYITHRD